MQRIEICGGIAAGKTTLAGIFEEKGYRVLYERFEDNPFLKDFYKNLGLDNTLETEISFVMLHSYLVKSCREFHSVVCDFSLLQDYAYGFSNLSNEDYKIFQQIYGHFTNRFTKPDIIIYLQCDIECLLERLHKRGRADEQTITADYLHKTVKELEEQLKHYNNVLTLRSDEYDFMTKDRDFIYQKIIDCIKIN
mgnify:CR=1 FL=1